MLVPLSVLTSSVADGGFVLIFSLNYCTSNFRPTYRRSILTVGDGIISTEGLELESSTFSPSSQSEEKHQQSCFSTSVAIFTIPASESLFLCFTSSSESGVGHSHCICGVSEDLWWIPKSLACRYICFRSIIFCVHTSCLVRMSSPFWILYDTFGPFPMYGTSPSWCECFESWWIFPMWS